MAAGQDDSIDGGLPTDISSQSVERNPYERKLGGLNANRGLPRIASELDYDSLTEGSRYIDPTGQARQKPYIVSDDSDYFNIPEGAEYIDPEGKRRSKPIAGGMGFTTNALYNMALTPESKKKILQDQYGDRVKTDITGPYVENDDGTYLRPGGRDTASFLGGAAAETLPAVGATAGMLAGAAGGSGMPGAGTALGGMAGGMLGAAAGRQANNILLSILGVHDPLGEQVSSMGREAALAGAGEVIGRGVGAVGKLALAGGKKAIAGGQMARQAATPEGIAGMKRAAEDAGNAFENNLGGTLESFGVTPQRAVDFLGATPETLARVKSANEMGFRVPPSAAYPTAPMLGKMESFHKQFSGPENIFEQSAREGYERVGRDILKNPAIGGEAPEGLTTATQAVSGREAGNLAIKNARMKMQAADQALDDAITRRKAMVVDPSAEVSGQEAQRAAFQTAYDQNVKAANNLIQQGIQDISKEADAAIRAGGGQDLARNIAGGFRSLSRVVKERSRYLYDAWDQQAPHFDIDVEPLKGAARDFLDNGMIHLEQKYPMEVRLISRIADAENAAAMRQHAQATRAAQRAGVPPGQMPAPPEEISPIVTAGELHMLRSWMRSGIDYSDLAPGMKEGAMRRFAGQVDNAINGIAEQPGGREALKSLATADKFYADNIPYLRNEMIKKTLNSLRGGTGADPEVMADIFFAAGKSEDVRQARKVLGDQAWQAVEGAHIKKLINQNRALDGSVDAAGFAKSVQQDLKNGMLEMGYSAPKAGQMVNQAKQIRAMIDDLAGVEGKIPLPPQASSGDMLTLLRQAHDAKMQIQAQTQRDPIGAFDDAIKEIDAAGAQVRGQMQAERKASPLNFLLTDNMTYKGEEAAKRILSHPDAIIAARDFYGPDSPTFDALRQLFVRRTLQRDFWSTGNLRKEISDPEGVFTDDVMMLMFPGVTRQQFTDLAKNMEFLFGSQSLGSGGDFGASLAGAGKILHPSQHGPKVIKEASKIPVVGHLVDTANRYALGWFYNSLMKGVSDPGFTQWLTRGLNGGPAERAAVKQVARQPYPNRAKIPPSQWLGAMGGIAVEPGMHEEPRQQISE